MGDVDWLSRDPAHLEQKDRETEQANLVQIVHPDAEGNYPDSVPLHELRVVLDPENSEDWDHQCLDRLSRWEKMCEPTEDLLVKWKALSTHRDRRYDGEEDETKATGSGIGKLFPGGARRWWKRCVKKIGEMCTLGKPPTTRARMTKPKVRLEVTIGKTKDRVRRKVSLAQVTSASPVSEAEQMRRSADRSLFREDLAGEDVPEELMRWVNPTHSTFLQMQEADPLGGWVRAKLRDDTLPEMTPEKEREVKLTFDKHKNRFSVKADVLGYLARQDGQDRWVPYIPAEHRPTVLYLSHDHALGGHAGITKTKDRMRRRFWWPNMETDVERWLNHCQCGKFKSTRSHSRGRAKTFSHYSPFECVQVDCVGPFPTSRKGCRYWLTICDRYSRDLELVAIKDQRAETVAKALFQEWVCRRGAPRYLISDNGGCFVSELVRELCDLLGTTQIFSAPYHPQSNGLCERVHRFAEASLRAMTAAEAHAGRTSLKDWPETLPAIRFGIITSRLSKHRVSPFEVLHGFPAVLPADLLTGKARKVPEQLSEYYDQMVETWDRVRSEFSKDEACEQDRARIAKDHRNRSKGRGFLPGQWVYYWRPFPADSSHSVGAKKLFGEWRGPGQIVSKRSGAGGYLVKVDEKKVERVSEMDLSLDRSGGRPQYRSIPKTSTVERNEQEREKKQERRREAQTPIRLTQADMEKKYQDGADAQTPPRGGHEENPILLTEDPSGQPTPPATRSQTSTQQQTHDPESGNYSPSEPIIHTPTRSPGEMESKRSQVESDQKGEDVTVPSFENPNDMRTRDRRPKVINGKLVEDRVSEMKLDKIPNSHWLKIQAGKEVRLAKKIGDHPLVVVAAGFLDRNSPPQLVYWKKDRASAGTRGPGYVERLGPTVGTRRNPWQPWVIEEEELEGPNGWTVLGHSADFRDLWADIPVTLLRQRVSAQKVGISWTRSAGNACTVWGRPKRLRQFCWYPSRTWRRPQEVKSPPPKRTRLA